MERDTMTFIELGGLNPGEFDQMLVAGDLLLSDELSVSLIDGFNLDFNQQLLIGDVDGSVLASFPTFAKAT